MEEKDQLEINVYEQITKDVDTVLRGYEENLELEKRMMSGDGRKRRLGMDDVREEDGSMQSGDETENVEENDRVDDEDSRKATTNTQKQQMNGNVTVETDSDTLGKQENQDFVTKKTETTQQNTTSSQNDKPQQEKSQSENPKQPSTNQTDTSKKPSPPPLNITINPSNFSLGGKFIPKNDPFPIKPLNETEEVELRNYLTNWEDVIKRIFELNTLLSSDIVHYQKTIDEFKFGFASLLLLFTVTILAFRVFAFIFDNKQNYKRLPTSAKTESRDSEQNNISHGRLYVANNPQMIFFGIMTFIAVVFIKFFPFISGIGSLCVLVFMIFTAVLKVLREGKGLEKNVNEKRVVISFVSFVVGCAYVFGIVDDQNALWFSLMTLLFMVILRTISEQKKEFFTVQNIIMVLVCAAIIRLHITYKRMIDTEFEHLPKLLQMIINSDLMTYGGLTGVTFISYGMIRVMMRFGAVTRPFMVKLFLMKNTVTFIWLILYWFQKQGYMTDYIPTALISAEIIYISSFAIFIIQLLGLFNPKITCIVDPEQEKEYPLKRIKECLFFILFNIVHVFILIGGPSTGIQYVLMYLQIFTFFEICSGWRVYNSLVSSLFTILTALQYFLATGHGYDVSSLQAHQAQFGLEFFDKAFAAFFIYLNAYAPVIFWIFWSLQMVIKEQSSDEKLAKIILDISKDEENTQKDIIVLKKKLSLNLVHEFALRCMFFLYSAYLISIFATHQSIVAQSDTKEYTTNKFFFESIFVGVCSATCVTFIFFLSFA
jgi:hypothetical protein